MSVLRAHRHERNFTILGNPTIRDQRLSFRARGLLVFLLSQEDGYSVNAAELAGEAAEGRDAIITALKELEALGYLARRKEQGERGRWATFTDVYEAPELAATDYGFSGVGETRRSEAITAGRTDYGLSDVGEAVAIEKELSSKKDEGLAPPARDDVQALCSRLADRIIVNGASPDPYRRKATTKAWCEPMRLLLDRDLKRDKDGNVVPLPERVAKVERAIDWCQGDEFWRGQILSPANLREKYDRLRLAAQRPPGGRAGHLRPVPPPIPEADLSTLPPKGDAAALDAWADQELARVFGQ